MPPRTVQAPRRRDTKSSNPLSEVPRWVWFVSAGVVAGVILIGVILSSSGSSTDAKAAMLAAGCTYKDVKPLPPKDKTNYHADVPSSAPPPKASGAPHRRRPGPLRALGRLGLLPQPGQPATGRPQRGARRRRHLVGQQGPRVDRRPARGLLQPAAGRRLRYALPGAREQDRADGMDGASRQLLRQTATTASATSRSARSSTRRRSRRSARLTAARARRASRSRPTSRAWDRTRSS